MDIFGLQKGISLNQIQSGESLQDETESDSRVLQDIRKANRITVSENVSLLKEYYDLDWAASRLSMKRRIPQKHIPVNVF